MRQYGSRHAAIPTVEAPLSLSLNPNHGSECKPSAGWGLEGTTRIRTKANTAMDPTPRGPLARPPQARVIANVMPSNLIPSAQINRSNRGTSC
jgi:hypothetical protein